MKLLLSVAMDARLRKGLDLFNAGRFFESHEILEGFYQDSEEAHKPFLEGLIQLAVAFRLYRDFGDVKGPVRMAHQALIRFEAYQPAFLEIGVEQLSQAVEAWASAAERAAMAAEPLPRIPLSAPLIS